MDKQEDSQSTQNKGDWKQTRDRGSPWLIDLIIWIILNLGRTVGRLFLYPIVLYFIFSSPTRRYSRSYLQRNFQQAGKNQPGYLDIFRHYYSFSNMLLDRVFFLTGKTKAFDITLHNEHIIMDRIKQNQGLVLLGSHLGNFDALRALANADDNIKIRALMYNNDQQNINRAFEKLNPSLKEDVIEIGTADAMIKVQEDINNGYIIGMLADRIEKNERTVECQFLGGKVLFPSGPIIVAHLLKAPVVLCFALHQGGNKYDIYFHLLNDKIDLPRSEREQKLQHLVQEYANILEQHAIKYPYNWYNFYDFWQDA
jgi:predicted LPLAT superfamily acyltransferase